MEWVRVVLTLLTSLISSAVAEMQVSSVQPTTMQYSTSVIDPSFPVYVQPTTMQYSASVIDIISLDPTTSLMMSATPHLKPTPTPISKPTPSPRSEFLKYQNATLYLIIHDIFVRYKEVVFYTSNLTSLSIMNTTLNSKDNTLTFKRFYSQNGKEYFYISFIFMRDTDGTAPSWYIANFMHRNVSDAAVKENTDLLFQYTGLQYSVGAPIDRAFKCSSLVFHGTTGEMENETNSSLTFEGITIQAFTKNGLLSPDPVICGEDPQSKKDINTNLIIGVVMGVCGAALILTVVVAIVFTAFKIRRRDYDILND